MGLGRFPEALAAYRQAEAVNGQRSFDGVVATYARMGDSLHARQALPSLMAVLIFG